MVFGDSGNIDDNQVKMKVTNKTVNGFTMTVTNNSNSPITSRVGFLIYSSSPSANLIGQPGSSGVSGTSGSSGSSGTSGVDGATGPQGNTGPTGPQGSTGPTRPTGTTGPQGESGDQYTTTSTSSIVFGLGQKTLQVESGLAYAVGQPIMITHTTNAYNKLDCTVISYNSSSGQLVANVDVVSSGGGTFNSLTITLSGASGLDGSSGTSGNDGATGPQGATGPAGPTGPV